jgi:hypothetical protein
LKNPEDVLRAWMAAINCRDAEAAVALYDEHAVLVPTFSNRIVKTPEKIRDYFERLGSREDLGIALHETTLTVQPLGNDLHSLIGIYCWRFDVDGELFSFEARFTYIVDLKRPRPIIHHHSSQIPRVL